MKKFIAVSLSAAMVLSLAACGNSNTSGTTASIIPATTPATSATEATEASETEATEATSATLSDDEALEKSEGVMTYAEYAEAAIDDEVVIEAFVQAKQSWWDDKATVYLQDPDGAYFCYEMECSEEDYDLLVEGQKIKVTGFKAEWSGEIEITDATFEIEDGLWISEPVDATDLLGTDELIDLQNQRVSFADMTVVSIAFKNDQPGDDIYVTLSLDDEEYEFCLEYYLNGDDADFYDLVSNLQEGDVVDVEGFLYWYEGPNTHITSVTVVESASDAEDNDEADEDSADETTEESVEESEEA
jgi:hypothetical protein